MTSDEVAAALLELGRRIMLGVATQEELLALINEITFELGEAVRPEP